MVGGFALIGGVPVASAAPPTPADKRLLIELIAAEPDIVTPTGIAVDERGRIWVIENHTHQRPAKYKGPASDRIRILEDFGPDGKARKISTWAEGFHDTMGIAFGKRGDVFVATRSAIYRLRDRMGAGQADDKLVLARLETKATYPHNGLSGFAIDALGDIYFGLGENFGEAYKLIGTDNVTLTGGGEGGSIYRMKPDGSGLTRIATGFWNPFHMAFDRWGRLFAVDNDPDARGPCRLLHIIEGGDYGYRFKYGRKGIHPFQSWNGELPGTLPMVAGTAEAPSGIVAYESDGLPASYRGLLLVTSWGDHVIEQFELEPRGASFGAKKHVMVRGGNDFRPVGIAVAPDGSLLVSDWVDQSYPVHGKGRIWRIRAKNKANDSVMSLLDVNKQETAKLKDLLTSPRRDVRLAAAETLASREQKPGELLKSVLATSPDPLARLQALWALVARWPGGARELIEVGLVDKAPEVRGEAAALATRLLGKQDIAEIYILLTKMPFEDPSPLVRMNGILACGKIIKLGGYPLLLPLLADEDPFVVSAAMTAIGFADGAWLAKSGLSDVIKDARYRLGILLVLRRAGALPGQEKIPTYLADADPAIRRAAIQWVGEENLSQYAKLLDEAAIKQPVSRELLEAWLAAKELLANPGKLKDASKELGGDAFVVKIVTDAKQPPSLRALALRMLRPDYAKLSQPALLALTKDEDAALRSEAIKTLTWRGTGPAQQALRELASDAGLALEQRADAILGLALSATKDAETRALLIKLTKERTLAADAMRSLRGALPADDTTWLSPWWQTLPRNGSLDIENLAEHVLLTDPKAAGIKQGSPRPDSVAAWREFLMKSKGEGDSAAGERVFFHARGPRCFACHRIDGRGEAVGPDLSRIGSAMIREKLIESILEPSKEIAPAFVTWQVTMRDGKQHIGVIALESFDSKVTLVDALGKRTVLPITDIEERVAQKTSIMPPDLHKRMTRREFVDLLAYLEARK